MKKVLISVNGKQFEVELLQRDANTLTFTCNGQTYTSSVSPLTAPVMIASPTAVGPMASALKASGTSRPQSGEISAPMPGIVVSIPVSSGQQIAAGDTVAVIEAMKMENNIRCTLGGVVKEILVKSGDEVSHGQLLIKVASK